MTNDGTRPRRTGALGNQTLTLPRARVDQRQTIVEVVVLLIALLLVAALALRLFAAGPPPIVHTALLPLGAAMPPLGR